MHAINEECQHGDTFALLSIMLNVGVFQSLFDISRWFSSPYETCSNQFFFQFLSFLKFFCWDYKLFTRPGISFL